TDTSFHPSPCGHRSRNVRQILPAFRSASLEKFSGAPPASGPLHRNRPSPRARSSTDGISSSWRGESARQYVAVGTSPAASHATHRKRVRYHRQDAHSPTIGVAYRTFSE